METLSRPKQGTAWFTFLLAFATLAVRGAEPPTDSSFGTVDQRQAHGEPISFDVYESLESHKKWYAAETSNSIPAVPQSPIYQWESDRFYLHRLPLRYDGWGIRDDWRPSVLVRGETRLRLPQGESKFLIRTRGLSRLWVDGQIVAATKQISGATNGHQPVQPLPEPPAAGLRAVGYGDQESFGTIQLEQAKECEVVYEFMVGGDKFRANPGETLVAYSLPGTETYSLLGTDHPESLRITEPLIEQSRSVVEQNLVGLDDQHRRLAASTRDAYWRKRRALARTWLCSKNKYPVPSVQSARWASSSQKVPNTYFLAHPRLKARDESVSVSRTNGNHPIDQFIEDKIVAAKETRMIAASSNEVLARKATTILQDKCNRCHGEKSKGGLRLDQPAHLVGAGDSGQPAIVPGAPEESMLIYRIGHESVDDPMPPKGPLDEEDAQTLRRWIVEGAPWPASNPGNAGPDYTPLVDDAAFLPAQEIQAVPPPPSLPHVSWANYLSAEANSSKLEAERRACRRHESDAYGASRQRYDYLSVVGISCRQSTGVG